MRTNNITPSQQQTNVIDGVKLGIPKIEVHAGAGTGKSTLLEMVVGAIPKSLEKLYIVFNKSGEVEAKKRFAEYDNINIRTVDAFARWLVNPSDAKVKNYKVQDIEEILSVSKKVARQVINGFEAYCNSDSLSVPRGRNAELIEDLWSKMDERKIPLSFGYILKKAHIGLANGYYNHKVENIYLAMIDEYQDTNPVSKAIFEHLPANVSIKVGDKHQSIYGFRGAVNVMDGTGADKVFPLTVSYRYNQKIADLANRVLSTYKGEENLLTGKGNVSKCSNYCLLSRTNAHLIYGIRKILQSPKGYRYKTIRNASDIFTLPIAIAYLDKNGFTQESKKYIRNNRKSAQFLLWEEKGLSKSKGSFVEYLKNEVEDIEIKSALSILESIPLEELERMERITDEYNKSEQPVKFYLSTIHTAKGLEWDHVTIADDMKDYFSLMAKHHYAHYGEGTMSGESIIKQFKEDVSEGRVDNATVEEFNLLYVAITRAKAVVKLPSPVEKLLDKEQAPRAVFAAYEKIIEEEMKREQKKSPLMGMDRKISSNYINALKV